jgi:hypothetical protein
MKDNLGKLIATTFDKEAVISIDVPEADASPFLFSIFYIDVKRQDKILKYGSLRKKIAMRRARVEEASGPAKTAEGGIEKTAFLRELEMLRAGVPKKVRHPKESVQPRDKIQCATYVNPEGVKKDIRDLDYMSLLKMVG